MKNIILTLLSVFILAGCSTSSLNFNDSDELVINYGSDAKVLTNTIRDKQLLNFKDLFVTIYRLEDKSGRVLFYEDASTAMNFEFKFGGLYSVMYIFDNTREYEELYRRNNLRLVQLKLKHSQYLNIMIQASDTQCYSYLYGFSNEEFIKIAEILKVNEDDKLGVLKHKGRVFNGLSKPLSEWNDKMVYFAPLITPFRGLGGR